LEICSGVGLISVLYALMLHVLLYLLFVLPQTVYTAGENMNYTYEVLYHFFLRRQCFVVYNGNIASTFFQKALKPIIPKSDESVFVRYINFFDYAMSSFVYN